MPRAILAWLERRGLRLALAMVAIASIRIVATYSVFNHTFDEPFHIGNGMEWLDKKTFRYGEQPPLSPVAAALGPYLLGIRSQGSPAREIDMYKEGADILYHGHRYDLTLSMARLGILPFFWIACLAVYWWGRRSFGGATAAAAVLLFSFLPPVLAHAGLATTDMALTASLGALFLAALVWVERPTLRHS